jgi:hypothetical protein
MRALARALTASAGIALSPAAVAGVDILAPMQRGYAICKEQPRGFLAVRREAASIVLVPAQFSRRPLAPDTPVLDFFLLSSEAPPDGCWMLDTATDVPVLLRGLPGNERVPHLPQLQGLVRPGTDSRIATALGTFDIRFPSLDPRMRAPGAEAQVKILRIASGAWECRLGRTTFLDGKAGFEIVLAADFNGDGLPDIVVENSPKAAFRNYEVFVSERSRNTCRAVGVRKQHFD